MKPSFTIKKDKGSGLVSLRLPYKGGVFQVSTGIKVKLEEWETGFIPHPLCDTLEYFKNFYKSTNVKDKSVVVTEWDKFNNGEYKMLSSFILDVKNDNNASDVYRNCMKHIISYCDIEVGKINSKWYKGFSDYLLNHPENYSTSYISKMISVLRTVLKIAYKNNLLGNISFLEYTNPIKPKYSERLHLTKDDVERLRTIDLDSRLNPVRNIFVLMCLSGLKYSKLSVLTTDMVEMGKSMFNKDVVYVNKGNEVITIPVINDHMFNLFGVVLGGKFISPQKFNEYMKEVAIIAGFNDKVTINEFKGNEIVPKEYMKWQLFNSELARHSFFVNAYLENVSIYYLLGISGKNSIEEFMNYIQSPKQIR